MQVSAKTRPSTASQQKVGYSVLIVAQTQHARIMRHPNPKIFVLERGRCRASYLRVARRNSRTGAADGWFPI